MYIPAGASAGLITFPQNIAYSPLTLTKEPLSLDELQQ